MKKLPIGIQDFEEIRKGGYYYVDKTKYVWKIANEGKYYFLSRPRRFGKSLFISTLKYAFEGREDLFEGLYIYKRWNWSEKCPVIHISFGEGFIKEPEQLMDTLFSILNEQAERFNIGLQEKLINRRFFELIRKISKSLGKVVLLIDEYDKPILDNIENEKVAGEVRDILKNFYAVIKEADPYLKFVFMTGVSKFSKVSLFSGLNNLQDITIHPDYTEICGYTEEEMCEVFSPHLKKLNIPFELIRKWYNGYSWGGQKLYNPFDILLLLSEGRLKSYWFETGTPEFLIKILLKRMFFIPRLERLIAEEEILESLDVGKIKPEALLFQTGYLTIDRIVEDIEGGVNYILTYPNYEVKKSLNSKILEELVGDEMLDENRQSLKQVVIRNDFDGMKDLFSRFFSGVPYYWLKNVARYEGYWASVFYAYFVSAGFDVRAEDTTSQGRIDMTVFFRNRTYIFEFKVLSGGKKDKKALEQIRQKKYWQKYSTDEIYIIGVEFDPTRRNIVGFEWEKIKNK